MTVTLVRGDAAHLPLPDSCVDLIVTSPPYFALRSYQDTPQLCARCIELIGKDWLHPNPEHLRNLREAWPDWDAHVAEFHVPHHYPGQIGSEATPGEFVDALIACTREWVRVLKPSGSLWVNLGDKYAAGHGGSSTEGNGVNLTVRRDRPAAEHWAGADSHPSSSRAVVIPGTRAKSLMGLPWRYALRCIDDLGLILRAEVIWNKPNGLPESVTDRVRRSHEQWFHLVKRPRYYAAVDTIREPGTGRIGLTYEERQRNGARTYGDFNAHTSGGPGMATNPLGKLPGSVWTIPSQPLTVPAELGVDHFAAFPMEWPRRLILGWSPSGICTGCGEGRRPVTGYDREPAYRDVEDKRISEAVTVQWCAEFADWCDTHGIARRALDAAAGTSDMGAWWASRLSHRCAVPTPEQYALLVARWPAMPAHPGDDLWEPFTRRVAWAFCDSDKRADDPLLGRHRANSKLSKVSKTVTGECCACTPYTDHPERRGKDFLAGSRDGAAGRSANGAERNRAYREGTSGPSGPVREYELEDWAPPPTRPAVVLDPFSGTGTVCLMADVLGRHGIGVDLSHDYNRLARWRTTDPGERARAMQVDKPETVADGQMQLFA